MVSSGQSRHSSLGKRKTGPGRQVPVPEDTNAVSTAAAKAAVRDRKRRPWKLPYVQCLSWNLSTTERGTLRSFPREVYSGRFYAKTRHPSFRLTGLAPRLQLRRNKKSHGDAGHHSGVASQGSPTPRAGECAAHGCLPLGIEHIIIGKIRPVIQPKLVRRPGKLVTRRVAPAIADLLAAAVDYGAETPAQRLARFEALGELLKEDRGFGFRVRDTVGDREILEAWTDVLSWWMRAPGGEVPEAGNLRARQRFVADNLEFRLGVAIGAVVAQRWTAGAGDPLAVPSLAEWKATTGLPWFGFWARELLRWGTLDPFVAFALAQGRAKTREDAEALRPAFEDWLGEEIDAPTSEDLIDPQQFLAWERSLPARERERAEAVPDEAELTGTTGAMKRYNVLPMAGADEVIWLDRLESPADIGARLIGRYLVFQRQSDTGAVGDLKPLRVVRRHQIAQRAS